MTTLFWDLNDAFLYKKSMREAWEWGERLKVITSSDNDKFVLKESYAPYNARLDTERSLLWSEKMYYWNENQFSLVRPWHQNDFYQR